MNPCEQKPNELHFCIRCFKKKDMLFKIHVIGGDNFSPPKEVLISVGRQGLWMNRGPFTIKKNLNCGGSLSLSIN